MKKITVIILVIIMTVTLTGCGTPKEVPQLQLNYYIDDYLSFNALEGYIDSTSEITHNWDKEAKIDTVQLKVITEYEYGYIVAECECAFQYDKSSDTWYVIGYSGWEEHIEYREKLNGAEFEGIFYNGDAEYLIMISSIDFDTNEVVFLYKINGDVRNGHVEMGTAYKENTTFDMDEEEVGTVTALTTNGSEKEIPVLRMVSQDEGFSLIIFLSIRGIEIIGCHLD